MGGPERATIVMGPGIISPDGVHKRMGDQKGCLPGLLSLLSWQGIGDIGIPGSFMKLATPAGNDDILSPVDGIDRRRGETGSGEIGLP